MENREDVSNTGSQNNKNENLDRKDATKGDRPKIGDTKPAPKALKSQKPNEGNNRRRRKRRKEKSSNNKADSSVAAAISDSPVELDAETLKKRRGRERKGKAVGRYTMVVHVEEGVTQLATLEGRSLIEFFVSRPSDDVSEIHGNVYMGRVENVLPGMEAAFVDIGTPKNAVLYLSLIHI